MAKQTIKVVSEFGTFTRQTARPYQFLVISKGYRAEVLEALRLAEIKTQKDEAAKYRGALATGVLRGFESSVAGWIADGSLAKWAEGSEALVAKLEARGPITVDGFGWGDYREARPAAWVVNGWCSRFDLARKLADSKECNGYRQTEIIDVATGKTVEPFKAIGR